MSVEVSNKLRELIIDFVRSYSNVVDLELEPHADPKPWFMPLSNYENKKEAAHYFLLAASLSEYMLTGNPRNIVLKSHKHAFKNIHIR